MCYTVMHIKQLLLGLLLTALLLGLLLRALDWHNVTVQDIFYTAIIEPDGNPRVPRLATDDNLAVQVRFLDKAAQHRACARCVIGEG